MKRLFLEVDKQQSISSRLSTTTTHTFTTYYLLITLLYHTLNTVHHTAHKKKDV